MAAGLALAVLAGCGSDDGASEEKKPKVEQEESAAPASYLPVPDGTTLTEPGTALDLGDAGTIAFERRQGQVGILEVTVERIERTSFEKSFPGWSVDDATAAEDATSTVFTRALAAGPLAVELEDEPKHAVGRRMLRPEIDRVIGDIGFGRTGSGDIGLAPVA